MLASVIQNSTNKSFPDFIRNSSAIGGSPDATIEKVFPNIGLPNHKENIDAKFDFAEVQIDKVIHLAVKRFIADFHDNHCFEDLKGLELFKVSKILYVFEELSKRLNKRIGVAYEGGTVKLTSAIQSYDGKPLIKRGTDCFKLVKDLLALGSKYSKAEVVDNEEIAKECKNLQVVFSSADIEGAWDIATMSMRGVKSCMRWEARQASALVGSITDPCCGIIYLTNGSKTKYGPKMLFRALVRLVIESSTGNPALLVDRLYSSFYKNKPEECNKLDEQVKQIFVKHLRKKLPGVTVLEVNKDKYSLYQYSMPKPTNYGLLTEEQRSYKDTKLEYTNSSFANLSNSIYEKLGVKTGDKVTPKKKRVSKKLISF